MSSLVGGIGIIGQDYVVGFRKKKKNLLVNVDKYNPYVFVGDGDGTTEKFRTLDMYAYLEKGKKYKFSFEVDGIMGSKSGTDTVEAFLMKDRKYIEFITFFKTKSTVFTLDKNSGNYYVRVDINKNDCTHTWKNFRIEEVS